MMAILKHSEGLLVGEEQDFSVLNSRRQSHTKRVKIIGKISAENKDKLPSHGILEKFKLELVKSPLLKVFWQHWPFSTVVAWHFYTEGNLG